MTHDIFRLLVTVLLISGLVGVVSLLSVVLATSEKNRSLAMVFCFVAIGLALISWFTFAWVTRSTESPFFHVLINLEAGTHFYLPLAIFLACAYGGRHVARTRARRKVAQRKPSN